MYYHRSEILLNVLNIMLIVQKFNKMVFGVHICCPWGVRRELLKIEQLPAGSCQWPGSTSPLLWVWPQARSPLGNALVLACGVHPCQQPSSLHQPLLWSWPPTAGGISLGQSSACCGCPLWEEAGIFVKQCSLHSRSPYHRIELLSRPVCPF